MQIRDIRSDNLFNAAIEQTKTGIRELSNAGVPDAEAITQREEGVNNLSGHAHSLVPLAVFFARNTPSFLSDIKESTSIENGMGPNDSETRLDIWSNLKERMRDLIDDHGDVIISEELSTRNPQSVSHIASTYLPSDWGGEQDGGGGGTVIKRTLKLLAHLQIA